ncbi:MAG: hypothetical protein U5N53_11155 [Mycobacterium sp.]|nr:hypothetical protein [Mycobacterium sp.]
MVTQNGNSALAAYAAFCGAAAARYAEGGAFWDTYSGPSRPVVHFEVWNEEYVNSSSKRWVVSTLVDEYSQPDLYAKIYNAAAAAIFAVPYALPVAALCDKTWNSPTPGAPYLDEFLAHLGRPLGGVSIHPYTLGYLPASYVPAADADRWKYFTQTQDVRAKLDAAGHKSVELHITEMGWPNQPGFMTEEQQASRFTDLWTTVQSLGYVKSLILFTTTNPDLPDNPALPGYSTDQYNFYGLWHTGSNNFTLGGEKAAVGTITSLAALTTNETISSANSVTHFTLDGLLLRLENDTEADQYTDPDRPGLVGTISARIEHTKGQLLLLKGLNPQEAWEISEVFTADINDDGSITKNGGPWRLPACTSIFNLEEPFQYRLSFDVFRGGRKLKINPFNFYAPDSDVIKRIAGLSPVPSASPEGITQGDDGPPGKTLHWEGVLGGYQQFDDDGQSYGAIVPGLTLLDAGSIDGGTAESEDTVILDGGTA